MPYSKLKLNNDKNDKNTSIKEFVDNFKNEKLELVEKEGFIFLQIPEDKVISRSGGLCVVSLMDQWFLDYKNEEWKILARKCLERMEMSTDTREKLEFAVEWINKWGFSRNFGLGTVYFDDKSALIDSLSDSTIYMAFYTVKHLFFSDLEGKNEILKKEELSFELWDYVFMQTNVCPEFKYQETNEIVKNARKQFGYFYPVDLRVSGKDLINNHLTFFIMNHVAIFDEKYWPRRIFTNGHLMLNSAKMSKSEGNFLTVDDALKKFGTSATRMCLLACGDTNEDANFVESMANSFVLKLYTITKTVLALKQNDTSLLFTSLDNFLISSIKLNKEKVFNAYESIVFRDVLKYGFYENLNAIETYELFSEEGSDTQNLKGWAYYEMLSMLYPVIPSLSRHLKTCLQIFSDFVPSGFSSMQKHVDGILYIKEILRKCMLAKGKSLEIIVVKKYADWKENCISIINSLIAKKDNDIKKKVLSECSEHIKINKKKGSVFCMDYYKNPEKYVLNFNEFEYLNEYKNLLVRESGKTIKITCLDKHEKSEPGNPFILSE